MWTSRVAALMAAGLTAGSDRVRSGHGMSKVVWSSQRIRVSVVARVTAGDRGLAFFQGRGEGCAVFLFDELDDAPDDVADDKFCCA